MKDDLKGTLNALEEATSMASVNIVNVEISGTWNLYVQERRPPAEQQEQLACLRQALDAHSGVTFKTSEDGKEWKRSSLAEVLSVLLCLAGSDRDVRIRGK